MLLDWKGECPPGVNKLVFPNGLGNVENLANIHRRCWYPLQERAAEVFAEQLAADRVPSIRAIRDS